MGWALPTRVASRDPSFAARLVASTADGPLGRGSEGFRDVGVVGEGAGAMDAVGDATGCVDTAAGGRRGGSRFAVAVDGDCPARSTGVGESAAAVVSVSGRVSR